MDEVALRLALVELLICEKIATRDELLNGTTW